MDEREIRLRCIEAVAGTGVTEPSRLVRDAKVLEEWVLSAPVQTVAKAKAPT